MYTYLLEFILSAYDTTAKTLQEAIRDLGENSAVVCVDESPDKKTNCFKINIQTQDPTLIFDVCGQFGRITSVKIDER